MDGKEIFNEIINSPKMKELLGISENGDIHEDFEKQSQNKEITVIRNIIEGQIRHHSDDAIFKNIKKLYDL